MTTHNDAWQRFFTALTEWILAWRWPLALLLILGTIGFGFALRGLKIETRNVQLEEQEASLEGVEVDDAQIQGKRIADQISEMIKSSPTEAGSLLGKWVRPDD